MECWSPEESRSGLVQADLGMAVLGTTGISGEGKTLKRRAVKNILRKINLNYVVKRCRKDKYSKM